MIKDKYPEFVRSDTNWWEKPLNQKWAKGMTTQFTKEENWMTNISVSLNQGNENSNPGEIPFYTYWLIKLNTLDNTKCWQGWEETGTLVYNRWE